jgi:hypothetical protein
MACFKRFNCRGPEIPGGQWGGGVDVCQFHLNAYAREFGDIDESFSSDYARIKLMLERKEAVKTCMRDLAGEMDKEERSSLPVLDRERYTADGYVKFSAFLSRYEHLCWFPPSHHVFLGFVRNDDFLELIRQGVLAKDPGAGPLHGDFTHRLQWHVISRVITNNFSVPKRPGWDHTPVELLSSFGSGWAKAAKAWAWGLEKGDGFDHPDNFHAEVRGGGYGRLSEQIAARFNKRSEQQRAAAEENPRQADEEAKDHYFRTTGIAADANIAAKNKLARRYVMEKTLVQGAPVARRTKSTPSVKDTMPIGARIMMSRKSLRIDGGVFCENLGVLESRKWAHPYEFL